MSFETQRPVGEEYGPHVVGNPRDEVNRRTSGSRALSPSGTRTMAGEVRLTPKQQRFILEYPTDGNAAAAARRAGYSAKTAKEQGYELLTKPHIFEAVQQVIQRHLEQLDLGLERIIQEAARVGISDIGDLFDADGHVIPTHQLPHDIRKAISSIKVQHIPSGVRPIC